MRIKKFSPATVFFLAVVVVLGGCDMFAGSAGRITDKLKDAPFPYEHVSEANITITRIEMLGTSGTKNWLVGDLTRQFNLLNFRNGATATIVPDVEIPAGTYDRIRISMRPTATVVLKNGTRFSVDSGTEAPVIVQIPEFEFDHGDDEAEAVIDFDVEQSFTAQGDVSTVEGITGFTYFPRLVAESFKLNNETMEVPAE
ncbi:MAG: DUF4382 domain-containing protein [Rhodothermales bacterium]|nr:DUF4382 domain-containing protein [Rhodothermales bacterium]